MTNNKNFDLFAKIVARAWSEEHFKKKLLENPTQVLKEAGVKIPEGQIVTILENTDQVQYLVLPKKNPANRHSDDLNASGGICGDGNGRWRNPMGEEGFCH